MALERRTVLGIDRDQQLEIETDPKQKKTNFGMAPLKKKGIWRENSIDTGQNQNKKNPVGGRTNHRNKRKRQQREHKKMEQQNGRGGGGAGG